MLAKIFLSIYLDVDECLQKNGGCSHICVNDIGTYHCECPEDMLLSEDRKTCKGKNLHKKTIN